LGNLLEQLVVTNIGKRPCLLRGYPTITAETPTGTRQTVQARRGGTYFGRLVPADLQPGGRVFLDFGTSDCGCRCERPSPVRYRNLVFTLPQGGRFSGGGVSIVVDCFLDMTPFGLPERLSQPQAKPWTPATLRANVRLPATSRAGATLRYVVTLTNPSSRTVLLTPCPAYTEGLANEGWAVQRSFALNCESVRAIPPHGSVAYDMKLDVPVEMSPATAKFGWQLNTPTGPFAGGVVRISAG